VDQASARPGNSQSATLVDEARFKTLPDDVLLDWRRHGWLPLVYCHLMSTASWAGLVELEAKKQ